MRRRPPAYSLLELSVAMAIAGIVSTAAIATFAIINRSVVQLRTQSAVETKLQRVLGRMVADVQEVGGGAVRPWNAVFLQPSEKDGEPDRLLVLTSDPYTGVCTVEHADSKEVEVRTAHHFWGWAPCCMDSNRINPDATQAWRGRFAVINKGDDADIVALAKIDEASCSADVLPFLSLERSDGFSDFEDGTITVVDAKWIALDQSSHELKAWVLGYGGSGKMPEGLIPRETITDIAQFSADVRVLARDVYDFQVALGFDVDLDGVVEDNPGGADEWLGNTAGEIKEPWIGDSVSESSGFDRTRFRMLDIAVAIGLPSKLDQAITSVQLLDGEVRSEPTLFMRGGHARGVLRNSGLFQ